MRPPVVGHRRPPPAGGGRSTSAGEAGTGLIGTTAAVTVFLVLLLYAVQLTSNLSTRSMVSAAGFDAARAVASRRVDHADPVAVAAAQSAAERTLRDLLGDLGDEARVDWATRDGSVHLHVAVDAPELLPDALAGGVGLGAVERTFVVRIEEPR